MEKNDRFRELWRRQGARNERPGGRTEGMSGEEKTPSRDALERRAG
jgi:hypothetical protein